MISEWFNRLNKKSFYLWIGLLGLLLGAEILATVLIPVWRNFFFDGIEQKSYEVFHSGLIYFAILMAVFIISQGFKWFAAQRLSLVLREALVNLLYDKWKNVESKVDYPDQRIQEDSRVLTEKSLEVIIEVVISALIIVGLVLQMWGSWLLLGLSAGYTLLITLAALFFHRPMVNTDKCLQRKEAGFRLELVKKSLGQGSVNFKKTFESVKASYKRYTNVMLGFTLFSRAKSNFMNLVPFLVLVPMYFAGDIGFGKIMEGVSQFDLMVINATILIILYPRVTRALAGWERIKEFYEELNEKSK